MKRTPLAITALLAVLFISPAFAATIPAGTRVTVRITENLSSGKTKVGQLFHGALSAPIIVNGHVVYAKGSPVRGKVLAVHPSGRLRDPGVLDLTLLSVGNGHSSSTLNTQVFRVKGESHTKSNVEKIGGTTAAGTVLGAIFGGGKGAAIGAASGAAAGTTVAAATGKKEATVESEAVLAFVTANTSRATRGCWWRSATVARVASSRWPYGTPEGQAVSQARHPRHRSRAPGRKHRCLTQHRPLVVVAGLGAGEGESGPWLGGFPMWLRLGEGSGETLALRVPVWRTMRTTPPRARRRTNARRPRRRSWIRGTWTLS